MVPIAVTITASDICDLAPVVALKSITMNEGDLTNTYDPFYDNATGDGNTTGDIQVDDSGNISLRAERSGKSDGRTYTITYEATDGAGNTSRANTTIIVPHNH